MYQIRQSFKPGEVNLLEDYGNDNPGTKSQRIKQLMAGGGVALIGVRVEVYVLIAQISCIVYMTL